MTSEESEARSQVQSAALQEIFRISYEWTKYGRSINIPPERALLQRIREIAREALL